MPLNKALLGQMKLFHSFFKQNEFSCGSGLQAAPTKTVFRHSDEACGALFVGIN